MGRWFTVLGHSALLFGMAVFEPGLSRADGSDRHASQSLQQHSQQESKQQNEIGMPFGTTTWGHGREAGRATHRKETSKKASPAHANSPPTQPRRRSFKTTDTAIRTFAQDTSNGPTTSKITINGMVLLIQPAFPCAALLSTMVPLPG